MAESTSTYGMRKADVEKKFAMRSRLWDRIINYRLRKGKKNARGPSEIKTERGGVLSEQELNRAREEFNAKESLIEKYQRWKETKQQQKRTKQERRVREEEARQRQLEEEKIKRARQEEIRMNEMRARERRLAEERAQQKRGRR